MGTGTVVGATKIVDNGPDSDQWNLVVVGDGYDATQQGWFTGLADDFVARLQGTSPFGGSLVWSRVNVYRLDVISDESGAINPQVCADGTLPFANSVSSGVSYFDAEYCPSGLRRALTVDAAAVMLEVGALVPDWDAVLVLVNHLEPGGTGNGDVAISYAGGVFSDTAVHELGHTAFDLGDEYEYLQGCASGETGQDTYIWAEPIAPNLTIDSDRTTIKWAQYIDPATPMPTTANPDPTQCDTQPSPVADGEIGAFEGGGHYHSGIYRPAYTCMMRNSGEPFCRVCEDVLLGRIVVEGSTCFVASAVYDDPWAPEVVALRGWRDRHLQPGDPTRPAMRALVAAYARVGPLLARWTRRRPGVRRLLRRAVFGPWARHVERGASS